MNFFNLFQESARLARHHRTVILIYLIGILVIVFGASLLGYWLYPDFPKYPGYRTLYQGLLAFVEAPFMVAIILMLAQIARSEGFDLSALFKPFNRWLSLGITNFLAIFILEIVLWALRHFSQSGAMCADPLADSYQVLCGDHAILFTLLNFLINGFVSPFVLFALTLSIEKNSAPIPMLRVVFRNGLSYCGDMFKILLHSCLWTLPTTWLMIFSYASLRSGYLVAGSLLGILSLLILVYAGPVLMMMWGALYSRMSGKILAQQS